MAIKLGLKLLYYFIALCPYIHTFVLYKMSMNPAANSETSDSGICCAIPYTAARPVNSSGVFLTFVTQVLPQFENKKNPYLICSNV